jgi:acyl-CoA reductase-like NAD-dependent aldehyde dehydrogenase
VHSSLREEFLQKFCAAVDSMPLGLPWVAGVGVTPLPEEEKPKYIRTLIDDAVGKGAKIVNGRGGQCDRTLVAPTVLFPVLPGMRVYSEEQFGPLVPVVEWSHEQELYDYLVGTSFGQQASIFTQNSSAAAVGHLIDVLSNQVSRINVNCQCQRGPDSFPFTGRKDSAYGTLSVFDALRVFSLRSLVAAKDGADAQLVAGEILQICYGVLGFILPNFASDIAAAGTSHVLRADKLLPG